MADSFSSSLPNPEPGRTVMAATASSLPLGTRLEEFELSGVLGEGGFSVVYVALDHALERTVAIKEYMPSAIATRQPDGTVLPRSPTQEHTFISGLKSFVNEARLLARFNHPALIHIHRAWEQNGTASMAMQYCLGKTLRQVRQTDPALVKNEGWLKATFTPILDALELLHAHNCFHRDLSPENILLLQNGAPILLDFGAARQVIGDMTQAFTVILKPGFAPIEQYADDSSFQQGAWTDVYGVGAVLYFLLMGKPPVASVARLVKDPMPKLVDVSDLDWVSRSFREAVDRALAVHPDQRIRSIAELRDALQLPTFNPESQFGGQFPIPPTVVPKTVTSEEIPSVVLRSEPLSKNETAPDPPVLTDSVPSKQNATRQNLFSGKKARRSKFRWAYLIGALGVVVLAVAIGLLSKSRNYPDSTPNIVTDNTTAQLPSISSEPAQSQTPPDLSASASAAQDQPTATPQASSSEPGAVAQMASGDKQALPAVVNSSTSSSFVGTVKPSVEDLNPQASTPPKLPAAVEPTTVINPRSPEVVASATPTGLDMPNQEQKNQQSTPVAQTQAPTPTNNPLTEPSSTSGQPFATVSRATSTVRFLIRPWGRINIDGQDKGISPPLTSVQLPPGNHTVVITNGIFLPVTKDIVVAAKGVVVVSHRFGEER
jgi:serine/threonine protein kinase